MKKIFLLACLFAAHLAVKAEYSTYYKVYYNGQEVENGATVVCSNAWEDTYKDNKVLMYQADINVVNQMPYSSLNRGVIQYLDNPTYEEYENNKAAWGDAKLCYHGGDANGEMASCMGTSGTVVIPDNSYDCFNWEVHLENCPPNVTSEYELKIIAATGTLQWDNYQFIDNSEFSIKILFTQDASNSIDSLTNDSEVAEYYTLSGVKVQHPVKGNIYILKKGAEVKKIIF